MRGSFQPTRPGFSSASNAGLRASSTAVRRSQDRGSTASRHLPPTVRTAATQRDEYGPLNLDLAKDADMVQWLQQQLSTPQASFRHTVAAPSSPAFSRAWNVEPLGDLTPPQSSGAAGSAGTASKSKAIIKAKTLPMVQLAVGGWKRGSKFEGDLVLKCYFTKRKLCWEILDGNLTYKCEMRWPEIQYLRSSQKDDVEMLELDVRQPPSFFEELDPQPKKRAVWKACQDFTGGQVSMGKRQQFMFLPGKLMSILPDFFALNQHLKHDHEMIEQPRPGPSESADSSEEAAMHHIESAYTEQDFLRMISNGEYAYPAEGFSTKAEQVSSSSQSTSSNAYRAPAITTIEEEHSSGFQQADESLEDPFSFLGEPHPARDSLDFDLPGLPADMPVESFLDLMPVDCPSPSLSVPEQFPVGLNIPLHQTSAAEDDFVSELMDLDGF